MIHILHTKTSIFIHMNTSASIDDLSKLSYITTKQHSFVVSYVDKRGQRQIENDFGAKNEKECIVPYHIYIT